MTELRGVGLPFATTELYVACRLILYMCYVIDYWVETRPCPIMKEGGAGEGA